MKYIVNIIRMLVGLLFIVSGFVKAIDPLGTSYKMHDYFAAFSTLGLHGFWEWMNTISLPIAVIMIVLEMVAGFGLLLGWANRFNVWLLYLMTMFFTVLTGFTYLSGFCPTPAFAVASIIIVALFTLSAAKFNHPSGKKYLLITIAFTIVYLLMLKYSSMLFSCSFDETKMKVTDCGCFGDALKLKPWETFWKDIVLDVLIFILIIGMDYIKPLFKNSITNLLVSAGTAASILFCFSNYAWGLPVIDFRPYKIGNNIRELRQMQKPRVSDWVFIYKNKKSGENKEFTTAQLSDMNSDDWDFVDRVEKVIDPGIPAKIDGFYISNADGIDITDTLLSDAGYSLMVVAYHLSETHKETFTEKLNPLAAACEKAGVDFYCVTGGDIPADPFRHELRTPYPFYTADETPLKTIIRSNPGLVLLKNGVVINMWHYRHIPDFSELNEKYFSKK